MGNVERISLSFPKFLLTEIDELMKKKGYSSRSELIRDATRKHILENNQLNREGVVSGIITIVYTPTKRAMDEMSKAYFEYDNLIKSMNQSYVCTSCGKNKKVEMFIVEGECSEISKFYNLISKTNGKIYDNIVLF